MTDQEIRSRVRAAKGGSPGVSERHVILGDLNGLRVFDHDGRFLRGAPHTSKQWVGDRDLVLLVFRRHRSEIVAYSADNGTVRWSRPGRALARALTPTSVVISTECDLLEILDRSSGKTTGRLPVEWTTSLTAVRDIVVRVVQPRPHAPADREIIARSFAGDLLWRLTRRDVLHGTPHSIGAGPGRVYVAGNRFVACFEETAA